MIPVPENEKIPSVAKLNRDMEPYVIQSVYPRSSRFEDKFLPLQFVHFADIHWHLEHWNRIMEYINEYSDTIEFALHTGDYCGTTQENYIDLYKEGLKCVRPVLNCAGNHDCYDIAQGKLNPHPKAAYERLFNHTDGWDVNFMNAEYAMNYYKDFPQANLRLIVLNDYYQLEEQNLWLKKLLYEALEKRIHVITASHEPTHPLTEPVDTPFQTILNLNAPVQAKVEYEFDHLIAEFKKKGGKHICHLGGHEHANYFSFTTHGILNCLVERAASWKCRWSDANRIRGTRTYDSFSVIAVDTNVNLLKIIRIGNNTDMFMRTKKVLCWDYGNNKIING